MANDHEISICAILFQIQFNIIRPPPIINGSTFQGRNRVIEKKDESSNAKIEHQVYLSLKNYHYDLLIPRTKQNVLKRKYEDTIDAKHIHLDQPDKSPETLEKSFSCPIIRCKFADSDWRKVKDHCWRVHNRECEPCHFQECGQKLYINIQSHTRDNHFFDNKCRFCEKPLTRCNYVRDHILNDHGGLIGLGISKLNHVVNNSVEESLFDKLKKYFKGQILQIVDKGAYLLMYDSVKNEIVFAFTCLKGPAVPGKIPYERPNRFTDEVELPNYLLTSASIRALPGNYVNGHLIPALHAYQTKEWYESTFQMGNVQPMTADINTGPIASIDSFIFDHLLPVCNEIGYFMIPVYTNPRNPVTSAGGVNVNIPYAFIKNVYLEKAGVPTRGQIYIVKNEFMSIRRPVANYLSSYEDMYKMIEMKFLSVTQTWEDVTATFKCTFKKCEKIFTNNACLAAHIKTHENTVSCYACRRIFDKQEDLDHHLDNHPKITCKVCSRVFLTAWAYNQHIPSHKEVAKYKCKFNGCDKAFICEKYLKAHMERFHNKSSVVCTIGGCNKVFQSEDYLKVHQKTHLEKPTFNCTMCSYTTYYKSNLTRHLLKDHEMVPDSKISKYEILNPK